MKINGLKYKFKSLSLLLLVFFFLLFPIIVKWACEVESQSLRNCNNRLSECLMCQDWNGIQWLNCDGCDVILEIRCDEQQGLYDACLAQQSNNTWWNNGWITISWPTIQQLSREGDSLRVRVLYSVNWTGINNENVSCTNSEFSVNWASHFTTLADEILESTTSFTCNLFIDTSSDTVTLTVNWWVVNIWSVSSSAWSQTFTRACSDTPSNDGYCTEWCANVNWSCSPAITACGDFEAAPWWWQCQACITWETKPNESHTRCICDPNYKCCWIQLNTVVPFIWDCIELDTNSSRWDTTSVNSVTAFPVLMQWLMKLLMSAIMVFSFLMVIVAWLMMTTWAFSNSSFTKWKTILKNVIISLILLWCSWLILSLINPSFFGG